MADISPHPDRGEGSVDLMDARITPESQFEDYTPCTPYSVARPQQKEGCRGKEDKLIRIIKLVR